MLSPAAAEGSADFRAASDLIFMMPPVESGSLNTRRWTLVAVCVTTFMLLLDITIVNVALPSIQRRLSADLTGLQWVVDAYALALAALILTAGALADRFGRRLLFMFGVVVFTSASLLCGLAWNITALDVARGLQGIGGAALFATALALIGHEYRGADRFSAIAVWGATVGAAVASGPLVGGILTDALGWRWVFFVNVPVGAFALLVARTRMTESRDVGSVRTDLAGLVTFTTALFLIVFGLLRGNAEGWASGLILSVLVAGAALLVLFVVVEARQERPMLDLSLFRRPAFVGVSVATFAIGAGMFALFPYLSIYLQDILGASPLGAGLRFLPLTAFVFVVPIASRGIVERVHPWVLASLGLLLVAIALLLMHGLTTGSRWTALLPGFVVGGIGIGLANPILAAAALRTVDPARSGMASGINNTFRLSGVSIGVAALGAVLEDRVSASLASTAHVHSRTLAAAVSSAGTRAVGGRPGLAHSAVIAFVSGLNAVLLVGCAIVFAGAVAAGVLMRGTATGPAAAADPSPAVAEESRGT
ncbi:MAG: DHA2 family efflux MFS transporter permease subunit [Actinobacteria bacterium]|nr:MAG: DHA2 family efflux MFS transporter permease subunit [Actinomycetota bacterium]